MRVYTYLDTNYTKLCSIATIIDYDWILVMHEGKIVESGTPEELLSLETSKFFSLATSQGISRPIGV